MKQLILLFVCLCLCSCAGQSSVTGDSYSWLSTKAEVKVRKIDASGSYLTANAAAAGYSVSIVGEPKGIIMIYKDEICTVEYKSEDISSAIMATSK